MKKLKMNLIKLRKQKKWYIEKTYIIEQINIHLIFETTSTFGRDIYNSKITTEEPDEDQRDLLVEILNFKKKAKSDTLEKKQGKRRCS